MATIALNFDKIKKDPQKVSNIKPFINKCNWEGMNYPSKTEDWKRFEKNYRVIALDILYIKEMEICPTYLSKINSYG